LRARRDGSTLVAMLAFLSSLVAALALDPVANGFADGAPLEPIPIYYGEEAGTCEFPSAAWLGSCTATLVHPEVVVYAAHCGSGYGSVFFGNDGQGAGFSAATEWCDTNPGWGGIGYGVDIAYCKLAEPVTEVAFTPPLMGCEVDVLQPGRQVWIVGFGQTEYGVSGVKHMASTTLNYIDGNGDASIGMGGTTVCFGDSGGPAYVRLGEDEGFDGSWRAFGIASYVTSGCGAEGFSALMHNGIDWVEEGSGIDVTPCHDADGTWNPSELCRDFPTAIDVGMGAWDPGCGAGPTAGWSSTCGEPHAGADLEPPTIAITTPTDGATSELPFGEDAMAVVVEVDAQDDGGIAEVSLVVDGAPAGALAAAPFRFEVMLASGEHELYAEGTDLEGNASHSTTVTIAIEPALDPSGADDESDEGGSDDDAPDDGDSSGGDDADDPISDPALPPGFGLDSPAGCACTSMPSAMPAAWLLLLAVGRRRPGSRSRRPT
jgi:uncharacterized protein (TIGR03382 family)